MSLISQNRTVRASSIKDIIKEEGTHKFKISSQGKIIKTFEVNEDTEILVGRSDSCDIVIDSSIVSRKHLKILVENKKCYVLDLGGINGTFVNRTKVFDKVEVKSGTNIYIDDPKNPQENGVLIEYINIEENDLVREKSFSLKNKLKVTIGRDDTCDIKIDHTLVSRIHCEITKNSNIYYIEDMKSTNNTFFNGKKLKSKTILNNNDSIMIGNAKFTYRNDELTYLVINKGFSLEAVNVCKIVTDKNKSKTLVDNVNFSIASGEFVSIVGGSGAGKSTLLDCLNGFRPATSGKVYVNKDDFYKEYNVYKSIIGYVPQKDIVYENLTVHEMLYYSAKLRMPKDSREGEIFSRISKVVSDVRLEGKEHIKIKRLSGGQKKRVSIAVELLSEPKLLFLDEPSSGLDPGMDKSIMEMLRKLSNDGTTIILITHATSNLDLCDKVMFLGYGGRVCYFGKPDNMLNFFEVENISEVYKKLSIVEEANLSDSEIENVLILNSEYYRDKLNNQNDFKLTEKLASQDEQSKKDKKNKNSYNYKSPKKGIGQLFILIRRYCKLIFSDKMSLIIMLGQAPLMVILLKMVVAADSFKSFETSRLVLFTIICITSIMGTLNSFLEICKEREILKREHTTSVALSQYIMSKVFTLGIICIYQGIVLVYGSKLFIEFPNKGIMMNYTFEFLITIILSLFAMTNMGLLISAYAPNTERATLLMPVIIIPQLIFSGVLFKLTGMTQNISYFIVSRWSMSALGNIFDINQLPPKIKLDNPNLPLECKITDKLYERSQDLLIQSWIILIVFVIVCTILSRIILSKNLKNEN